METISKIQSMETSAWQIIFLINDNTNNNNKKLKKKNERELLKRGLRGTFLVVQWLRLQAPNAGGTGSIPSIPG